MENNLAIVIPAYKKQFLCNALESIANQSCKDFSLYIGDDASPENLLEIIKNYETKIHIIYKRFETNLGSISLTQQWERCITLTKNEPYIWLFSDDDEMSENAVSSFYQELENSNNKFDLYRFNLDLIDEENKIIYKCNFPAIESNRFYFINRIKGRCYSCITQYIFKRSVFEKCNGFVSFPLAWFSDDASVIKFSENSGIKIIPDGLVKWRLAENVNITSSNHLNDSKAKAVFEYALWFNSYFNAQFNPKQLKTITRYFLSKRMLYMSIREYFRFINIKNAVKLVGIKSIICIYTFNLYKNVKWSLKQLVTKTK
jgi:glycosyltransferase involved in cell wall biosynthesis